MHEATDWEKLLHKMGKLKADMAHLQRTALDDEVPEEIQSTVNFMASDYNNLLKDVVAYEEGGGEMPDTCPVCGDEVVQFESIEAGESYEVDRICIREKTTGGPGHGIVHLADDN